MRIMKGKSKDPTYHVIQDVRRNGKRSTEIIENLGHASEICKKYNVSDADAWANEYIQNLRNNSSNANHKFLVPFYTHSFTIFSHALFSVRFPIISGVFESIFLCRILFIVPRVAKSVAITAKK